MCNGAQVCVYCFYSLAILNERDLFIYILFTPNNFCIFIKQTKTKKNYGKHNVFMYYIFLLRILNELSANYIQEKETKHKSIFQLIYWNWKNHKLSKTNAMNI